MRFSGRDANRIAAGRKTEHRIPRIEDAPPADEPMVTVRDLSTRKIKGVRPVSSFAKRDQDPRIGATFPVTVMFSNPDLGYSRRNPSRPRKEGHIVCHVRVLDVKAGLLHEAGELGARAEGHNGFEELVHTWWERHKTGCGLPGSPEFPVEVPVWVLRFELDTSHRPRLLAKASDANRGYTESSAEAIEEEQVEAVEDTYLSQFVLNAQDADVTRRSAAVRERENLDMERRIVAYQAEARARHIDVRSEIRALRRLKGKAQGQQVTAIRRKLDGENGMDKAA